ncbi:MAG TPA: HD domain-containing protein [Longimicrobiales bacterium]
MSEEMEVGSGFAQTGRTVTERMAHRLSITVPDRGNPRLRRLIEMVNADDELYGLWTAANVNAMERLGMTDHGPVHVKIVMNLGVKLIRALAHAGVASSIERNYGMSAHDAEVIVALASLLHDTGMSIHRADHEAMSLFVVQPVLRRFLAELYDDVATATVIRSETLHAIIGHRAGGRPLTIEAGVVRVADALDMAKGRSRIPFEAGSVSIHSISAAAVEGVRIEEGAAKPVRIAIEMSNSAGVFQLDQLFREKLMGSGLEPYIELEANIEGETEKRLLQRFRL